MAHLPYHWRAAAAINDTNEDGAVGVDGSFNAYRGFLAIWYRDGERVDQF